MIYTFDPAPDGPEPDPIPEPGTLILSVLAFAGIAAWRRRKRTV